MLRILNVRTKSLLNRESGRETEAASVCGTERHLVALRESLEMDLEPSVE